MPVVGFLTPRSAASRCAHACDVRSARALNELGYVEGRNVAIEYRWAEGQYRSAAGVGSRTRVDAEWPDHCVTRPHRVGAGGEGRNRDDPDRLRLQAATRSRSALPPASIGPGGNITGVIYLVEPAWRAKRLELLHEARAERRLRSAVLVNPGQSECRALIDGTRRCSRETHRAGRFMVARCKPPNATSTRPSRRFTSQEQAGTL